MAGLSDALKMYIAKMGVGGEKLMKHGKAIGAGMTHLAGVTGKAGADAAHGAGNLLHGAGEFAAKHPRVAGAGIIGAGAAGAHGLFGDDDDEELQRLREALSQR